MRIKVVIAIYSGRGNNTLRGNNRPLHFHRKFLLLKLIIEGQFFIKLKLTL